MRYFSQISAEVSGKKLLDCIQIDYLGYFGITPTNLHYYRGVIGKQKLDTEWYGELLNEGNVCVFLVLLENIKTQTGAVRKFNQILRQRLGCHMKKDGSLSWTKGLK